MGLAHRRADAPAPLDVEIAKPAVAVAVRHVRRGTPPRAAPASRRGDAAPHARAANPARLGSALCCNRQGANSRRSSSASSTSSGTGQVIPITDVRRKYSPTVVRPIPSECAIVRSLVPHAYLSRSTSRTFRIDNLSAGIAVPLGSEDHATGHRIVDCDPQHPPQGCPGSIGITVRLPSVMEWMPLLTASRCAKVAMFSHPTNGERITSVKAGGKTG